MLARECISVALCSAYGMAVARSFRENAKKANGPLKGPFVDYYNYHRYHEAIGNLTPADVNFGPGNTILFERERVKRQTVEFRRLMHIRIAAQPVQLICRISLLHGPDPYQLI